MFVLRQAKSNDLDDLHSLAKQTFFINLPPDREIIAGKIEQSERSFQSLASKKKAVKRATGSLGSGIRAVTGSSDLFLLVLEDSDGGGIIGTSQVIARMGGKGEPRVFLKLENMTRESKSLKLKWTHQMANLQTDESGPTEIGGLILNHAFRGHKLRLGRFLSFARFHLIGLYRNRFASRVVAEMLGPIDRNGYNPFFEKFTRHFIPRSFPEVYKFSQQSKEFVTGLMPPDWMDLSVMDPEVTSSAGAVGPDTIPARKMLERLGFQNNDRIDPLDGGPHLEAKTDAITLVKASRQLTAISGGAKKTKDLNIIASVLDANGNFRAVQSSGTITGSKAAITSEALKALGQLKGSLGATAIT